MKITEAGIIKRIEFPNKIAKQRYLENLRIDGKAYYVISEGGVGTPNGEIIPFIKIVEPWRNARLIKGVATE